MPWILEEEVMRISTLALLTLLSGAFWVVPVPGQQVESLGLKVGLNAASLRFDPDLADLNSKWGLAFGGFVEFEMMASLFLQPEILDSRKGASDEQEGRDESGNPLGSFTVNYNLDYLEIPFLLKLVPPIEGKIRPAFLAGPALGIKLSSKMKLEDARHS
jgi:hypothetical protein